ncbi:MAG: hypothetical protein N2110_10520, partial [Flavobacteriales bacterium]|nr:hypothetical protein [Flavobacteriales bacterium]
MITNNPPKQLPKGQEKEFAKAVWQEVNGYLPSDEELDEILINHGNDYRGIVKEILIGATDENADIALEQFLKKKGLQSGSISTKSFTESGFAQPGQQEIFSGDIESGIAKSPKESAASVAGQLAASLNFAKRQAVYNLKSVPKDVNNMFLSGDFEYSPLDVKGVYDRFNESVKTSSDIVKSEYENILKSFNTEIETKKSRVKEFDNFVKSTAEEYSNYIAEWLKANPDRVHGILSEVGDGNINEDELNRKVFEAAERHLETSSDGTYIQLRNKYQNVLRERELRVAELNSVFSKVKSEYDKAVKKMPGRVYDSAMSSAFGEAYALFKDINKDGKITEQIDKIVKYSKTNPEIADNLLGALNLNIAAELNKRNKLTPDIAKKFHDILYITTNLYDGLVDSDG